MSAIKYNYDLIAYHDSWISLDPIIGCRYNCTYCFLRVPGWTKKTPQRLFSPQYSVNKLLNHRYFVRDKTVISLGNRTDLFLEDSINYTIKLLEELYKNNLRNTICISTKSYIPMKFINELKAFKNLNLIIFLSLSGLPRNIEPGINHNHIKENLINLSNEGINVIHYWRPLIPLNSSESQLNDILDIVSKYSKCSVIVGLKYCPELRKLFEKEQGLHIPDDQIALYGEWLSPEIENKIETLRKAKYSDYPIFKHTSCAVSYTLNKPDYNATIYMENICKVSNCPESQRKICMSAASMPSHNNIQNLFKQYNLNASYRINKRKIIIDAEISQEEYISLLHNINFPISANVKFTNILHGSIFKEVRLIHNQ